MCQGPHRHFWHFSLLYSLGPKLWSGLGFLRFKGVTVTLLRPGVTMGIHACRSLPAKTGRYSAKMCNLRTGSQVKSGAHYGLLVKYTAKLPPSLDQARLAPLFALRLCLHSIPDSPCAGTKNISDRAFVHTQNADLGSIFMPGRTALLRSWQWSSHIRKVFVNRESNRNGSQQRGAKIGF